VAISPDGRIVAVGCPDGAVRLFDVRRFQPLLPLAAHKGWVRAVAFAPDGKSLISFGSDNKLLTWPLDQAIQPWRPKSDRLPAATLETLWNDLLDGDVMTGYAAVNNLAARPSQAIALLREHIKPVPVIDAKRVEQLLGTLGGDDFNARKRASADLRKLADLALPALREAGNRGHDELLQRMLERLEAEYPTRDQLRALRALAVLELTATPEAKKFLEELAGGAAESLLTSRAKAIQARLEKAPKPAVFALPSDELWATLANEEANVAFAAMSHLWTAPDKAVPFLRERLRVVAMRQLLDDPKTIAQWIRELDHDDFAVREKATTELVASGKAAEPALRKALGNQPSAEARQRIERALKNIDNVAVSPERLRAARALEVLEGIGDDRAREALEALGKEAKNTWLKEATTEALRRLKR